MTEDSMDLKWQDSWLDAGQNYLESIYEIYQNNPNEVEENWREYFDKFPGHGHECVHSQIREKVKESLLTANRSNIIANADIVNHKEAAVHDLINGYRLLGHLYSNMDPLKLREKFIVPELELVYFGLSKQDMETSFEAESLVGRNGRTLQEILNDLQKIYCGTAAAEFMHIPDSGERYWVQEHFEETMLNMKLSKQEKLHVFERMTAAEGLEQYLATNYPGAKRFGLEGCESLIVILDTLVNSCAEKGVDEIVIGMAHRGRLNVLVNILGKAPAELFDEFEGKQTSNLESGDVKYHQGFSSDIKTNSGYVHLALAFNPSHLEIVAPVICGSTRARQERRAEDEIDQVIPISIHGDSAFAGQGVVMETLQMAQTRGYSNGGTIRIIINNQIGFTTSNPRDIRSTLYCSDIGKMVQIPIFHVNAEDPEAIYEITKIAAAYRNRFRKDVIIDVVGYRKYGHNEADEPSATQPMMYKIIRKKESIRKIYEKTLLSEGIIDTTASKAMADDFRNMFDKREATVAKNLVTDGWKSEFTTDWSKFSTKDWRYATKTSVPLEQLQHVANRLLDFPDDLTLHSRVGKIMGDRKAMANLEKPADWGFAENLAYATLLSEGVRVRLSGQDAGRGTFFHRHSVLHDQTDGHLYIPLCNINETQAKFWVIDSLLSEAGVLAFEYGFSTSEPETLVIWEAQFGDFANGAQVVIDQFICSGEQKWGRLSGLTMFLPHGYEGQGPEHSSARMERYLQLCAQHNMQVCVPSTPAQVFHMIRRQILRPMRKPLIVMTPKSLLRHKSAVSDLSLMAEGCFLPVIQDDGENCSAIKRIILCSGKIYYELISARQESNRPDVAIIRIEQLYPFPEDELRNELRKYENVAQVIWCQEEPLNQGAWYSCQHHIRKSMQKDQELSFAGREASAAPAVGFSGLHKEQQNKLIRDALG